jgi:hypothetical protein
MTSRELVGCLSFVVAVDVAYAVGLWLRWPEKVYQKKKDSWITWYWLDLLSIPKTERNCVRFIRGCSIAGMILITLVGILGIVTFLFSNSN